MCLTNMPSLAPDNPVLQSITSLLLFILTLYSIWICIQYDSLFNRNLYFILFGIQFNMILYCSAVGGQTFISLLILSKWFNTPHLPTLNTTLYPICEGEGTKIFFQSPKSFHAEHFRLSCSFFFFVFGMYLYAFHLCILFSFLNCD